METFYTLDDITLLPSTVNNGHPGNKANFSVSDDEESDQSLKHSLPIFTSPMESIVGPKSAQVYASNGIKPVLSLGESLPVKLNFCQHVFCAFSMKEIQDNFINSYQKFRNQNCQYHLCIDSGNGHDQNLINLGANIKRIYGTQVILMGGNCGRPEVYSNYARAGFSYIRVGIATGSMVDEDKYGFNFPMASLLLGIKQHRQSAGIGLPRQVKVIADGGILGPSDIIKALALGADYVMCGRSLAEVIEAEGEVLQKIGKIGGKDELRPVPEEQYRGIDRPRILTNAYYRYYYANTSPEARAVRQGKPSFMLLSDSMGSEQVHIDKTLHDWVEEFQKCAYYAFMMTGSLDWLTFKKNIGYGVKSARI